MITLKRNTSHDGLRNNIEFFVLTHFKSFWHLAQRQPALRRPINAFLINNAVAKTKRRPYPLSTMNNYTSWDSLVDRTYHGRHLPPHPRAENELPDIERVIKLFERKNGFIASPKSTLLFAYFAQWFTDGFLRTDRSNALKTTSNHEIDLSPLYGLNPKFTQLIRSHGDGKLKSQFINGEEYAPFYFDENGQVKEEFQDLPILLPDDLDPALKPNLFAMGGDRANNQVGYVMLNTLFLREHNRLCEVLKSQNADWDDERLFQTARNIMVVLLIKIVIEEYINHIAPLYFKFFADPLAFSSAPWYRQNWIAIEFDLLYRWHSLIPDTVRLGGAQHPVQATFWNSSYLIDNGLGSCMEEASSQAAGVIGPFNTAPELMDVERASVRLDRLAQLASYNDYREVVGYGRVTAFDQISGDVEVQKMLSELYEGDVDKVEYYVGLFAEETDVNAVNAPLIGRLVALDAFSQALTNPLLAENIYNETTFSAEGLQIIERTHNLSDIVHRNLAPDKRRFWVSMTRKGWRPT